MLHNWPYSYMECSATFKRSEQSHKRNLQKRHCHVFRWTWELRKIATSHTALDCDKYKRLSKRCFKKSEIVGYCNCNPQSANHHNFKTHLPTLIFVDFVISKIKQKTMISTLVWFHLWRHFLSYQRHTHTQKKFLHKNNTNYFLTLIHTVSC